MIYRIQKNRHSSKGLHFGLIFKNKIKFEASFDPSCVYDLGTSDNYDVNKLFGFSTNWYHHRDSARIGWRCIDNENIQLLTYSYNKNKRQEPQLLGSVFPGEKFKCSIFKNINSFHFIFEKENKFRSITVPIKKHCFPIHYLLFPYFGGNMTAPHDMRLEVTKLKF